jgi:hypothetical protein
MDPLAFIGALQELHKPKRGKPAKAPDFLTPEQLCKRWAGHCVLGTLANWRNQGKGPPFRRFGNRVLYPFAGVLEYELAQLGQIAPPPPVKGRKRGPV